MKTKVKKSQQPQILIAEIFIVLITCLAFFLLNSQYVLHIGGSENLLLGLMLPCFLFLATVFGMHIYIEHKYNRLKLKNIFLLLGAIIFLLNFIAIMALPSDVILPYAKEPMHISSIMRFYYILSGLGLAVLPYIFFYLIPRRILHRRYLDIVLFVIVFAAILFIILSFILESNVYITIIKNRFKDVDMNGVKSIFNHKNVFGRFLFFAMMAIILLHVRKHKWTWLLLLIPCYIVLLFSMAKTTILVATIMLLAYLIVRLILLMKKSRNNCIIISSILAFVAIMIAIMVPIIVNANSGVLYNLKNIINKILEGARNTYESRRVIWDCAFKLLAPYQYIFGFGISSFGNALHISYSALPLPEWENIDHIYDAHNYGISLIGKGGVLLLAIYAFLNIYVIYIAIKMRKKTPLLSTMTIIFLVCYLIEGIFESNGICYLNEDNFASFILVTPILSEYHLCHNKDSIKHRQDIVKASKKASDINSSLYARLNAKRINCEAHYITINK